MLPTPLSGAYGAWFPTPVTQPTVNVPEPAPEPVKESEQVNVAGIVEMSLEPHTDSKSAELLQALQADEPQHESSVPPPPPFFKNTVHRANQGKRRRR